MPIAMSVDWEIQNTGFITGQSEGFVKGTADAKKQLDDVTEKLKTDPSDPSILAAYQAALSEYTLMQQARSNAIKSHKDNGSFIINNFKN